MSSSPQAKPTEEVTPRSEWEATLRATAIEVFSTMVGVTLSVPETDKVPVLAHVTGMVGIAGPLSAIFTLRCSEHSAADLASHMLGVSLEEASAQKCDAVGEICNIVAGYFKAKIGLGDRCALSVPTVIAGKDYKIRSPGKKEERLQFPLMCETEPIWMALDIRP